MNFQRGKRREDPEINLIAMIDVLLVILIFLMTTTTFEKISELQINLPEAAAENVPAEKENIITVAVDAAGQYLVNNSPTPFDNAERLSVELRKAAEGRDDPVILIEADAKATHQSVINIMEAARLAGYNRITFATQTTQ